MKARKQTSRIDVAVKIQSFLYDGSRHALIDSKVYKIERTYISGQFIELYFVETKIKKGDIDGLIG